MNYNYSACDENNEITVKIISSSIKWCEDLESFSHSVFMKPEWIEAVKTSNHIPIYLNFVQKKHTVAKIAGLSIKKKLPFFKILYFYTSPALLFPQLELYQACLKVLHCFAKQNKYNLVIIGSCDNHYSLKPSMPEFFETSRCEYIVELNRLIKPTSRFNRNVNKGKRSQAVIESTCDPQYIKHLDTLLTDTRNRRKRRYHKDYDPFYLLNLNLDTLKKLLESGYANIHYTLLNSSIDCMEFNIESQSGSYMLLKGTNKTGYKTGLSSLLSQYLINQYKNEGKLRYNQGGRPLSKDGDGLTIYKKSMGAKEVIFYGLSTSFMVYPYKLLNPILNKISKMSNCVIMRVLRRLF